MKIYRDSQVIADVFLLDGSYTSEAISGEHLAYLEFDTLEPLALEVDDRIEYGGNRYFLQSQEHVEKEETSLGYHYKITMYHDFCRIHTTVFTPYDRIEFRKNMSYYHGNAQQVMALVVKSMNRIGSGWSAGSVAATESKTFDFKDKTCGDVINDLMSSFELEFWAEGRSLNLGRREYASNGQTLSQGNGFLSVTLSAVDDATPPITRLMAYGGDTNVTAADGDFLTLPGGANYVEKNTEKYGIRERVKQFPDIFPKGEFKITGVTDTLTFSASGIDFDLKAHLIDGVEAKIVFETGGLAGYELAIAENGWDAAARRIKVVANKDETALKVPGDINFAVGDRFFITGIRMPDKYRTAAAEKLKAAALKELDRICEKQVQLSCKCDDIAFAELKMSVKCGQLVRILEPKLKIDREIRAVGVKCFIENDDDPPYRYELTLSDFLQSGSLRGLVDGLKEIPKLIENNYRAGIQFTKRRWADVMESMKNAFDPDGKYFTETIKPLVVHTSRLIVGTNSQQMTFRGVYFIPNYNGDPNLFFNSVGVLDHFSVNTNGTVRTWNIGSGTHSVAGGQYCYVYARCARLGTYGAILVTPQQITMEADASYYHFLVGTLNTPRDGVRSWQPSFGYTEIAGNQITTGVIKDRNARMAIDLENGTIYGRVTFRAGTTGYDNIADKPDLDGFKKNLLIDASSNTSQYISTAQNDLARKIGYSSWADMAAKATEGKTIVDGGYIRTNLINAEAIAAKILTAEVVLSGTIALGGVSNGKKVEYVAGITGFSPKDPNQVRIWAGASFEDRFTAPFRVFQDGRAYMTAGYIGNFSIQEGWLKYDGSANNDASGFIIMRDSYTDILIGGDVVPASAGGGITCTARIENRRLASYEGSSVALWLKATASTQNYSKAIAAWMEGGLVVKGSVGIAEEVYPLNYFPSGSDLLYYNTAVLQPSSNMYVDLPTAEQIARYGNFGDGRAIVDSSLIRLRILVTRYAGGQIWVRASSSSTPLLNHDGDVVSEIKMSRGDFLEVGYHNRAWYTLNRSH